MKGLKYIVLAANIVIFAVMALALPICFEENDDVMMAMIANGCYSGTPDCHLVFINVLYGAVLAALYSLNKVVEWYTLSFAVLHILSMSVLVYFVLTIPNRAKWERILWLLVLYVLWARIIVAFQFTTTAGLTCLAGCVLLLRNSQKARWTGVLFVLIASLIRFTAAGLVGLLMAPIIIYTYRLEWRRYIPFAVLLCLVGGCRMANNVVYQSDVAWCYYKAYNSLRAQLTDNPNALHLQPSDMPEGIDWTDYQLLLRFIPDPEQMDLRALTSLSNVVEQVSLKNQLQNIHLLDKYAIELAFLFALLILMILTTSNKSKHLFLILYTLFILALMGYVSLDGFLKNRVFLCMLFSILMTDFILLPDTTGQKRRWGIVLSIVTLCGWLGYQTNCEQIRNRHLRHIWNDMQKPIVEKVPQEALLVNIGSSFGVHVLPPFDIKHFHTNRCATGWLTHIPFNYDKMRSFRDLCKPNVYVMLPHAYDKPESDLNLIRRQMEKNYGMKTQVQPRFENEYYYLVQLQIVE